MTKRISQLTSAVGLQFSDTFPFVQQSTGQTKKTTLLELKKNIIMASAYLSATTSIPATTWTKVPMANEVYDDNSNYDTTVYRYTAPVNGRYHIDMQVGVGDAGYSNTVSSISAIYVNGVAVKYSQQLIGSGTSSQIVRPGVTCTIPLSAGDYVEVYAWCGEGSRNMVGGNAVNWFNIHLEAAV